MVMIMEAWSKNIVKIRGRERLCLQSQLEGQMSCTELPHSASHRNIDSEGMGLSHKRSSSQEVTREDR